MSHGRGCDEMGFKFPPTQTIVGSCDFLSPCLFSLCPCLVSLQESLIALALSTAQGFVWAGKPLEAIPAALQALRFSSQVFGSGSVQLVPIYLLLAEASTGEHCQHGNAGKGKASRIRFLVSFCHLSGKEQLWALLCLKGIAEIEPSHSHTPLTPLFCGSGEKDLSALRRSMKSNEVFSPCPPIPTGEAVW